MPASDPLRTFNFAFGKLRDRPGRMLALTFWVTFIVIGLASGFAAAAINSRAIRLVIWGLLVLAPFVLVFGVGLAQGCALRVGGQECFGYGFGMAMAFVTLPLWWLSLAAGIWGKRRFSG